MVCGGIWGDRVIGQYFLNDNVTGQLFREMLIVEINLHLKTFSDFDGAIIQLYGAPGHFALEVRNYLTSKFPKKWIGRTGDKSGCLKDWPPS